MSKVEFYEDKELNAVVAAIISDPTNHALDAIRKQELKVVPLMKSKVNNDGEHEANSGPPAKIIKVNDMWKLFTEAHYILVVDYYFFNHFNNRDAGIFNALCEVDVKAKDGEVTLATKKPEIQLFAATIQKYGAFDEVLLELREWMDTAKTKAAQSFAEKVSTGTLETTETPEDADEAEPPRIHAGPVEDEEAEKPKRRGGRKTTT